MTEKTRHSWDFQQTSLLVDLPALPACLSSEVLICFCPDSHEDHLLLLHPYPPLFQESSAVWSCSGPSQQTRRRAQRFCVHAFSIIISSRRFGQPNGTRRTSSSADSAASCRLQQAWKRHELGGLCYQGTRPTTLSAVAVVLWVSCFVCIASPRFWNKQRSSPKKTCRAAVVLHLPVNCCTAGYRASTALCPTQQYYLPCCYSCEARFSAANHSSVPLPEYEL